MNLKKFGACFIAVTMLASGVYFGQVANPTVVNAADAKVDQTGIATLAKMFAKDTITEEEKKALASKLDITEAELAGLVDEVSSKISGVQGSANDKLGVLTTNNYSAVLSLFADGAKITGTKVLRDGSNFSITQKPDKEAIVTAIGALTTTSASVSGGLAGGLYDALFANTFKSSYPNAAQKLFTLLGVTVQNVSVVIPPTPVTPDPNNQTTTGAQTTTIATTATPTTSVVATTGTTEQEVPAITVTPVTNEAGVPSATLGATSAEVTNNTVVESNENKVAVSTATFSIDTPKNAVAVEVKIPTDLIKTMTTLKVDQVTIKAGAVEFTLPVSMLVVGGQAQDLKIDLNLQDAKKSTTDLSTVVDVAKAKVFEITATEGGKALESFKSLVSFSVPFTLPAGAKASQVSVKFFDPATKLLVPHTGKYDAKTGKVSFKTTHFSTYVISAVSKTFKDMNTQAVWAKDAVTELASKGVLDGRTDTAFVPAANMTRAEFAVVVARLVGAVNSNVTTTTYKDIPEGIWYLDEVASLQSLGITMKGRSVTTFDPTTPVTREEMFTIMASALVSQGYKPVQDVATAKEILKDATDLSSISGFALKDIALLVREGMIGGVSETGLTINPKNTAQRSEAAQIALNFLNKQ